MRSRTLAPTLAAALLLALAGYSLQGRPQLAGQPKPPPERQEVAESEFAATRENMLGRFDRAWFWLNLAEGRQQRGDTKAGVDVIRSGLREGPNDADLWVGLGNALVVHADLEDREIAIGRHAGQRQRHAPMIVERLGRSVHRAARRQRQPAVLQSGGIDAARARRVACGRRRAVRWRRRTTTTSAGRHRPSSGSRGRGRRCRRRRGRAASRRRPRVRPARRRAWAHP